MLGYLTMLDKREIKDCQSYMTTDSSISRIDPNQSNIIMTSNNNPPSNNDCKDSILNSVKMLPKKRKFFPSEVESEKSDSYLQNCVLSNQVQSIVQQPQPPPQETAVDYSCITNTQKFSRISEKPCTTLTYVEQVLPPHEERIEICSFEDPGEVVRRTNPSSFVNLREWIDNYVLARQGKYYYPGIIRTVSTSGEVYVQFEGDDQKTIIYRDVFNTGKYDIISNASPPGDKVSPGARVCVRAALSQGDSSKSQKIFVEGTIIRMIRNPVRCVVKVSGKEEIVPRADVRLVLPPWWDELQDSEVSNGYMAQPNGSVQIHHVVPTLHTDYYHNDAPSPLHHLATPNSIISNPLSNASADDIRRRQYDDFGESDDDLRGEDIQFPSDAGTFSFIKSFL